MKRMIMLIVLPVLLGLATGCAKNVSANSYQAAEVGKATQVLPGVVVGKRFIQIDGNTRVGGVGMGSLAGAAVGGAGGSALGGSIQTNLIGAIGGAVIGGIIGQAAEKNINHQTGTEYMIKLKNGSLVSIAQVEGPQFDVNQKVLVIYGATTRVVSDDTLVNARH